MLRQLPLRAIQTAAALGLVMAIGYVSKHFLHVNQTTEAVTLLVAILAVSAFWGLIVSAIMSAFAMLVLNFLFVEPVGAFTVSDAQNWVALGAFLSASLIVSQLSARMQREAERAQHDRNETERLYVFSQRLLVSGNII